MIGPNGAGKTTLFNLLSNFIRPDKGRVIFDGEPIHHLQPYQIAQQGLVRTFQVARTLSRLSVLDNMLLAAQKQTGENFWQVQLQPHIVAKEEKQLQRTSNVFVRIRGLGKKSPRLCW